MRCIDTQPCFTLPQSRYVSCVLFIVLLTSHRIDTVIPSLPPRTHTSTGSHTVLSEYMAATCPTSPSGLSNLEVCKNDTQNLPNGRRSRGKQLYCVYVTCSICHALHLLTHLHLRLHLHLPTRYSRTWRAPARAPMHWEGGRRVSSKLHDGTPNRS